MKIKILFYIMFSLSLTINLFWGWYFYTVWYPREVQIPNSLQVNSFCEVNGFDFGWLSSESCDINQVMCHRKVFDMEQNECIDWNSNGDD